MPRGAVQSIARHLDAPYPPAKLKGAVYPVHSPRKTVNRMPLALIIASVTAVARWRVVGGIALLLLMIVYPCTVIDRMVRTGDCRSTPTRKARAQIGMLKCPLVAYELDVGTYPTTAQGLSSPRRRPQDVPADKWQGPYLSGDLLDPWDLPYHYLCPGTHNTGGYDVWAVSPQGEVIGNWPADARP
jgi:type II secretion system protein G